MADPAKRWLRHPGTLITGIAALALVGYALVSRPQPVRPLTITAGNLASARGLFIEALAHEAGAQLVPSAGVLESLDAVEAGEVDIALVPGAIRFARWPKLREVTPLLVEPLHLLVKQEHYAVLSQNLRQLRGKRLALRSPDDLVHWLAADLLEFIGLGSEWQVALLPGDGAAEVSERVRALRDARHDELPDAIFNLGMLAPEVARVVFGELGYRVLPLPYAEAFAQSAFMDIQQDDAAAETNPLTVQREFVYDAQIPAFVYQVEPAIPPQRTHTLGTRLLLVAHSDVDPRAVTALLEHIFHTRVARLMHPPLTPELLALPHELRLHQGSREYLRRNEPLITGDSADLVSNVLSIGGALVGGTLFVLQWMNSRRRERRHAIFDSYIRRIAAIERRASELELSSELELAPLVDLQRELARIRGEALERFLSDEFDDRTLLSELLEHASACREVLGRLILHVRDELEERARSGGATSV